MKLLHCGLGILLVSWSAAQAQQKPTLGPQPSRENPSLYGPRTSNTTDARKLTRVRTIFVERMDNALGERLAEGLSKMGRFRVVTSRNEADAVLRGSCADLRRLKTVRSEVYLNERSSGESIWQDSVRRPFNPPTLDRAVTETALLIVEHLSESLQAAGRR